MTYNWCSPNKDIDKIEKQPTLGKIDSSLGRLLAINLKVTGSNPVLVNFVFVHPNMIWFEQKAACDVAFIHLVVFSLSTNLIRHRNGLFSDRCHTETRIYKSIMFPISLSLMMPECKYPKGVVDWNNHVIYCQHFDSCIWCKMRVSGLVWDWINSINVDGYTFSCLKIWRNFAVV